MTGTPIWCWCLLGFCWLLALCWLWQLVEWLRGFPRLADVTRIAESALPSLEGPGPHLTVVVPACNEEAAIEATLLSLLASEGISLQILALNDRSTDRTGAIMEQVAGNWPVGSRHSIQVVHISELPVGWLGKPHALAVGAKLATADWILFTDGDVVFAPRAAALALRYAQRERTDHLVLMPDWTMKSHGEAAMHGALHALSTWTLKLWRVADPQARDFLGVGAFNLVRRDTYEAIGGFAGLRMEVLEDVRFGWKLKRAGFRSVVAIGPGLAAVRWSVGAWGVVRNLEKNLFALYWYRTPLALLASAALAVQIGLPLLDIFWQGPLAIWMRAAGVVTFAGIAAVYFVSRKVTRVPPWYVLLYPFAAGLFLFAIWRSVGLALWRGGILWRGTLYSLKELRTNGERRW